MPIQINNKHSLDYWTATTKRCLKFLLECNWIKPHIPCEKCSNQCPLSKTRNLTRYPYGLYYKCETQTCTNPGYNITKNSPLENSNKSLDYWIKLVYYFYKELSKPITSDLINWNKKKSDLTLRSFRSVFLDTF